MARDLEFSIIQYLDGALPASERDALERQLAIDVEARGMLDEHRAILEGLRGEPLPELNWEALAGEISAAVRLADAPVAEQPEHRFRISWRGAVGFAVAACVMLTTWIGFRSLTAKPGSTNPGGTTLATAVADVTGPRAEVATGPSDMSVTVGPSQVASDDAMAWRYNDEVISRPARVTVASGLNPTDNTTPASFDVQ